MKKNSFLLTIYLLFLLSNRVIYGINYNPNFYPSKLSALIEELSKYYENATCVFIIDKDFIVKRTQKLITLLQSNDFKKKILKTKISYIKIDTIHNKLESKLTKKLKELKLSNKENYFIYGLVIGSLYITDIYKDYLNSFNKIKVIILQNIENNPSIQAGIDKLTSHIIPQPAIYIYRNFMNTLENISSNNIEAFIIGINIGIHETTHTFPVIKYKNKAKDFRTSELFPIYNQQKYSLPLDLQFIHKLVNTENLEETQLELIHTRYVSGIRNLKMFINYLNQTKNSKNAKIIAKIQHFILFQEYASVIILDILEKNEINLSFNTLLSLDINDKAFLFFILDLNKIQCDNRNNIINSYIINSFKTHFLQINHHILELSPLNTQDEAIDNINIVATLLQEKVLSIILGYHCKIKEIYAQYTKKEISREVLEEEIFKIVVKIKKGLLQA